ncbi:MAG: Bax inhibitor-1/YccA family protein [Desulfobacteraceae bacterium]|nr:Bax inhibitor-1/YccA family protein [Desulfobacteraceae bacterium]
MAFTSTHPVPAEIRVNSFVRNVYNWMGAGLALTGLIAYYTAHTPALAQIIFGNQMVLFALLIGELVLVFALSARVQKMQASTATGLFLLYAGLNGLTFSFIFLVYTGASIAQVFFICAATFVTCSLYGWITQRDLTSWGGFLFMGLIGVVIASVVNMFLHSTGLSMVVSYIGVLVFVGLTAYDTQQLKNMALTQPDGLDAAVVRKGAIIGALKLYLDFINLFLLLLRIFGAERE